MGKVIAKSRNTSSFVDDENTELVEDGVTNVGCGQLSIGHIEQQKYGKKVKKVDRDIIITGDVINVATGCNRAR